VRRVVLRGGQLPWPCGQRASRSCGFTARGARRGPVVRGGASRLSSRPLLWANGTGRGFLPAAGSCCAVLVAGAAFLAGKGGGGIDGGAGVGIDTAALGADASPVAQQQGAAE
jgi:hypothetical protein